MQSFQGSAVQFVGYLLDYRLCLIGITKRRGEWLVGFIQDMQTIWRNSGAEAPLMNLWEDWDLLQGYWFG